MQDKHTPIDQDIERLMQQAIAEPGKQDPMGMVGFAATWAAAGLWIKSHTPNDNACESHEWYTATPGGTMRRCSQCDVSELVWLARQEREEAERAKAWIQEG